MNAMHRCARTSLVSWFGLAAVAALMSATEAGALEFGFGPRIGLSRGDNGFEFGGQFVLEDFGIDVVAPLRLRSSFDYGTGQSEPFGNSRKVDFKSLHAGVNLEYVLVDPRRAIQVYPIIGAGWFRSDLEICGNPATPRNVDCATEGYGFNIGGGVEWRSFSADAILGIGALPTLTITASLTFRL